MIFFEALMLNLQGNSMDILLLTSYYRVFSDTKATQEVQMSVSLSVTKTPKQLKINNSTLHEGGSQAQA